MVCSVLSWFGSLVSWVVVCVGCYAGVGSLRGWVLVRCGVYGLLDLFGGYFRYS